MGQETKIASSTGRGATLWIQNSTRASPSSRGPGHAGDPLDGEPSRPSRYRTGHGVFNLEVDQGFAAALGSRDLQEVAEAYGRRWVHGLIALPLRNRRCLRREADQRLAASVWRAGCR